MRLQDARLCVNEIDGALCDTIHTSRTCPRPRCGSAQSLALANILNRRQFVEPASDAPHITPEGIEALADARLYLARCEEMHSVLLQAQAAVEGALLAIPAIDRRRAVAA